MSLKTRSVCALLLAVLLAGAAACTQQQEDDARRQGSEVAQKAREAAKNAWAGLRTNGERLIDRVQTSNDPQAKADLLSQCRDALEKVRRDAPDTAPKVDALCTRIRDTEVSDKAAWDEVRKQLQQLNTELG